MIISDVRVEENAGYELSALVTYESKPADSVRVWFRIPAEVEAPLPRGDAFFAGLVVPCMALHEDPRIEAPLSRQLVQAARDPIMTILNRWHRRLRVVEIEGSEAGTLAHSSAREPSPASLEVSILGIQR